jgi:hypothetical protein
MINELMMLKGFYAILSRKFRLTAESNGFLYFKNGIRNYFLIN